MQTEQDMLSVLAKVTLVLERLEARAEAIDVQTERAAATLRQTAGEVLQAGASGVSRCRRADGPAWARGGI